ncbi:MAG: ABC transporter permease [Treponema sp.]|nr:ABC transporter permease [Treponema sp.]
MSSPALSAKDTKEPPGAKRNYGPRYSYPMGVWFTLFFLAPIIIIVVYSFLSRGLHGGVVWEFSLEAYRNLVNPAFLLITRRTLYVAVISTLITLLIALPCGYFMARSRFQTLFLLLIIIPFWTNFLIRVFAWMLILGNNGLVNNFLLGLGIIKDHLPLMYNQQAVILVSVYMYLPYAILPLYANIDKFDFSLLEAARDLGAPKLKAIVKVLLPNIKSGLLTAVLFTFIPIFGAYAVPQLVGGLDSYMLGNIIADQILRSRNWPLASSISIVITVVTTIGIVIMMGLQRRESEAQGELLAPEEVPQ